MNNLEQAAAAAIAAWERDGANYDAFCQRMDALREALAAHRRAELVVEAVAIVQHRKQHCADWYDGHADHADGGGPYEERVLYTHPPEPLPEPVAEPVQAAVLESLKAIVEFADAPLEAKRPDVFFMRINNARAAIARAEQAEPVALRPDVLAFLQGAAPLDGVWFGEKPGGERCQFWWRKYLPTSALDKQAEPVDLDQQVRDISAGIGLRPTESPIVPDPVIDCYCGRRWCWTDDAGWNAKQVKPVVLTEVDPITGITFKATLKFDPEPVISAIEDGESFEVLEKLAADFRKGLK